MNDLYECLYSHSVNPRPGGDLYHHRLGGGQKDPLTNSKTKRARETGKSNWKLSWNCFGNFFRWSQNCWILRESECKIRYIFPRVTRRPSDEGARSARNEQGKITYVARGDLRIINLSIRGGKPSSALEQWTTTNINDFLTRECEDRNISALYLLTMTKQPLFER